MSRKCPEAQMVTNRRLLKELLAIAILAQASWSMLCVSTDLLSEGARNTEKGEYHTRSFEPLGVLVGFDVPVK